MPEISAARRTDAVPSLLDSLDARAGIVCFVGAGGKKTAIGRLARLHPGRVGIASTTKIPPLPGKIEALRLALEDAAALPSLANDHRCVAFTGPQLRPDRFAGLAPDHVARLHAEGGFAATYVKADGARMRLIKAPGADEPRLVPGAAAVVPVLSVRAIGRPLDGQVAHRPERIAGIAGIAVGDPIDEEAMVRLMRYLCRTLAKRSDARIVPLLNMADNEALAGAARRIAAAVLAGGAAVRRIVISSLIAPEPVVAIVDAPGVTDRMPT